MKLDCVLTACNMNPLYYEFIPLFIKAWNKLYPSIDVKIILINHDLPSDLELYKNNIIVFKPIPNISTAFISQYIRLLYPCILNYNNGILITDIDMIPMNSTYYTKNIENIDDSKFIYYRHVLLNREEIAMCYNVALSKTWSEIFNIKSIDDIIVHIIDVYSKIKYVDGHGKNGWSTDQVNFYKYVMEWNKKTNNFKYLNDNQTGYYRLCRDSMRGFSLDKNTETIIKSGKYSDYHVLRPYSKYKLENDTIVDFLPYN
jgi:hypothetical protein